MKKAATPHENNGLPVCAAPAPANTKLSLVSGQAADVLAILLEPSPKLAIETPAMGIPKYCARIHDLRAKGCNIISTIEYDVSYQRRTYSRAAHLSLGNPLWIVLKSGQGETLDLFPDAAAFAFAAVHEVPHA